MNLYNTGSTLSAIASSIITNSTEFTQKTTTWQDYVKNKIKIVDALKVDTTITPGVDAEQAISDFYREIIGREPDAAGLKIWVDRYNSGISLSAIRWAFLNSSEATARPIGDRVKSVYNLVFGTDPAAETLTRLTANYTSSTTNKQIINDLVNSAEFKGLSIEKQLAVLMGTPGENINLTPEQLKNAETFLSTDKIASTYYFYWYTGDQTNFTNHPLDANSYELTNSVEGHKKALLEMINAGIDVFTPVSWGQAGAWDSWSVEGLKTIVQAWNELKEEGYDPPKIAMFFDTSSLAYANLVGGANSMNLTQRSNQLMFYGAIRDFMSIVPTDAVARLNGETLVWLYSANPNGMGQISFDQGVFDFVQQAFKQEFGGQGIHFVAESTWNTNGVTGIKDFYYWGAAAYAGMYKYSSGSVAQIGPGYDDRNYPGRNTFKDRLNGDFYRNNWEKAIASGANIICIETWNEYFEGSQIAASTEFGRLYLDITKEYINRWKGL